MDETLRDEDVSLQEFRHPSGELLVRAVHLPTGVRCEVRGRADQERDEVIAELLAALASRVREAVGPD